MLHRDPDRAPRPDSVSHQCHGHDGEGCCQAHGVDTSSVSDCMIDSLFVWTLLSTRDNVTCDWTLRCKSARTCNIAREAVVLGAGFPLHIPVADHTVGLATMAMPHGVNHAMPSHPMGAGLPQMRCRWSFPVPQTLLSLWAWRAC